MTRKTRVIVGSLLIGGLLALGLGTTPAAAARVRIVAACIGWDHTGPYVDPFTGETIDAPSIVIMAVSVDGAPVGAVLGLVLVAPDGRVFDVLGEVGEDGRLSGASGIFTFGVYRVSGPVKIAFTDPTTGAERTVTFKPTTIVRGGSFNVQFQEVECRASDLPAGNVLTGEEPPPPVETESPPVETESPPPIAVEGEEGGLAVIWLVFLGVGGVVIVIGVFVLVSGRGEGIGRGELVHPGGAGELVHPGGATYEPVYPDGPPPVVVEDELPVEETEEYVETIDTSEAATTQPETATEEEDCDELRGRCAELTIAAANAASRATETRRRASEAKSKCNDAKRARELAENALAAAERDAERKRDDESWMESEGRRRTSEDLRLEREDAREAYEAYRRGEITPQQLEDAWRKSGDWDRLQELRKKEEERRKKRIAGAKDALEKAKKLEESICKDAEAQETANEAEEAARQAQAEADRACKAADDCQRRRSEGAPSPFGPRLGSGKE